MALEVTTSTPDYWGIAGRVATVFAGVFVLIAVFVWRALMKALFVAGMKESRADFKAFAEETVWKDRIAAVDAGVALAHALEGRVEVLATSVHEQGKDLMDQFTTALSRQTQSIEAISEATTAALERMTSAMDVLTRDSTETREQVANMAGFLRATSGGEFGQLDRRTTGDRRGGVGR